MHEEHEIRSPSKLKTPKGRWRLAFTAISFTRALLLLSKNVLESEAKILRSLSYVAIDVQPAADADDKIAGNERLSILDVDPKALGDIVRDKNIQSLMSQYGGVKDLVETLETDVKWYYLY